MWLHSAQAEKWYGNNRSFNALYSVCCCFLLSIPVISGYCCSGDRSRQIYDAAFLNGFTCRIRSTGGYKPRS